jgi:hypothetical protein
VPFVFVQLPSWPLALQVLPSPQEATTQQTPSVQKRPLAHGTVALHAVPRPTSATQVVPEQ